MKKKITIGLVAAIAVVLMSVTAFAMTNEFGPRNASKNARGDAKRPEGAEPLFIEHDIAVGVSEQAAFRFQGKAVDTRVSPTQDDFPKNEAIRIAKAAILQAYALPEDGLNHSLIVANLYVTNARPDYRRWFIQFQVLREGSDNYVEKFYSCIIDPEGNVIGDPDINEKSVFEYAANKKSSVIETYNDYVMNRAEGWDFQYWPLELKADFSEKVLPEVSAIVKAGDLTLLENGGDIDYALMAIAMHRYGLPRETDITIEQAYQIAANDLQEHYGLSQDMISHYDQWYYSYDITDPDQQKWCIVFWPGGSSAMYLMNTYGHDQSSCNYRVEINPADGMVLNDLIIKLPYSRELSWLVNRYRMIWLSPAMIIIAGFFQEMKYFFPLISLYE